MSGLVCGYGNHWYPVGPPNDSDCECGETRRELRDDGLYHIVPPLKAGEVYFDGDAGEVPPAYAPEIGDKVRLNGRDWYVHKVGLDRFGEVEIVARPEPPSL